MKEDYSFHFTIIFIFLSSMVSFALTTGEYYFIGIMALPVILSPFIKFRFSVPLWVEYIIYGILIVPVIVIYSIKPAYYLFMPYLHLLGFYFIFVSIVIFYRVKRKNDLTVIYFLSIFILILSGLSTQTFYFELFIMLILLLSSFYLRHTVRYDYKTLSGRAGVLDWMRIFIISIISIMVFITANRFVCWLEPRMNVMLIPPGESGQNYSGFFNETNLNVTGNLKLSDNVFMRIFTTSPLVRIRGRVFTEYNQGKWKTNPELTSISPGSYENVKNFISSRNDYLNNFLVENPPVNKAIIRCKVKMISKINTVFFSLPGTFILQSDSPVISKDQFGIIYPDSSFQALDYGIISDINPFVVNSPDRRESTLSLPSYLAPQILPLSLKLTLPEKDIYEKCVAVEAYFHNNFTYSLNFKPDNTCEPILEFLNRKSAHCEYFATAMVLLLRASNIPSRYVTGFLVHENSQSGYYIVRERDSHAWVEAYVPGKGWVTFDPTPSGGLFQELLGSDSTDIFTRAFDFIVYKLDEFKYFFLRGDYFGLFKWFSGETVEFAGWISRHPYYLVILLPLFLFIFKSFRIKIVNVFRKSKNNKLEEPPDLKRLHNILSRFDKLLKKVGYKRPVNLTLYEYVDYLKEHNVGEEKLEICSKWIDNYCIIRYSSSDRGEGKILSLEKALAEIEERFLKG